MTKELFPGWLPIEMAKYYGFPIDKYTGEGQSIAVISLGGKLDLIELEKDFKDMGVPMPNISVKRVNPDEISAAQDKMFTGETHLDVEVLGSICPRSKITIYIGSNPHGFAAAVNQAIEDRNNIISISWGMNESTLEKCADMEKALEKAKDSGITVCVAAGDGASSNARDKTGKAAPAKDGKAHVLYPASSQFVLACGGTMLMEDKNEKFEVVWNNADKGRQATGGGVSDLFELPAWQRKAAIDIPSANTGKLGRIIPDVAGIAAGGDWEIFESEKEVHTGGSSAVAPLWASLIALVNEARAESGKSPLGFINDRLYELAAHEKLFNDITVGNNRPTPDYPGYDSSIGFDACAGWGSPLGQELVESLTNL